MKKILIGSPVHQSPEILKEFLESLKELEVEELEVNYCFIDDNSEEKSRILMDKFKEELGEKVKVFKSKCNDKYLCDDYTHQWSQYLVRKVTLFKNHIINIAKSNNYDYLFFIDSDIVLHPKTLNRLVNLNKEIVSNIFWTKWSPDKIEMPQVWLQDAYAMHKFKANEKFTQIEEAIATNEFLNMLKIPGTYEVGGLGACTLISKSALEKGVNFDEIYNVSFWGEDRYFCIRAAVLGIKLWVDTYYPSYHIYRKNDLDGVGDYKNKCKSRETEILASKLLDVVKKGIEGMGTYSYKSKIDNELLNYFNEKEGKRQISDLENSIEEARSNNTIMKTKIAECEFDFPKESKEKINACLKYIRQGYCNGESFYKEFYGVCKLEQNKGGRWIISECNINKEVIPKNAQLVRYVKEEENKLTLSMIVKNEEKRYLKMVLEAAKEYIDSAVIIDDGSTDNTISVIEETLKNIPLKIIRNKESKFNNEFILRKQQWEETISTNPDWILFLDSDEIFEDKFKYEVKEMMANMDVDGYIFRLYDFWDENHYREDKNWCAHKSYRLFMIRYQKNFNYIFNETAQHCGRMPANATKLLCDISKLRLKHYGWAKEKDREEKYNRYITLDRDFNLKNMEQYMSILDTNPNLVIWSDNE